MRNVARIAGLLLAVTLRPGVPEPVSPAALRRMAKLLVGLSVVLAPLQVLGRWLLATGRLHERVDMAGYDRFLAANLPGHAVAIAAGFGALGFARRPRVQRVALLVAIAAGLETAATGLWLDGGVSGANALWFVVIVLGTRLYFDAQSGLVALVSAIGWAGVAILALGRTDPRARFTRGVGGGLARRRAARDVAHRGLDFPAAAHERA